MTSPTAEAAGFFSRRLGVKGQSRPKDVPRELTWFSTSELQHMLCYLDVLAADRAMPVAITHPDSTVSVVTGLGDPQAARMWLLQALTGRRASEDPDARFRSPAADSGPGTPRWLR
jgi:hypothetical protein